MEQRGQTLPATDIILNADPLVILFDEVCRAEAPEGKLVVFALDRLWRQSSSDEACDGDEPVDVSG